MEGGREGGREVWMEGGREVLMILIHKKVLLILFALYKYIKVIPDSSGRYHIRSTLLHLTMKSTSSLLPFWPSWR